MAIKSNLKSSISLLALCWHGSYAQQPAPPAVTVAPQTAVQTGAMQTAYPSISGITANSLTTTVVAGKTTVLPVWYCGPKETAAVCKNCPAPAANQPAKCEKGFNALVLLPLLALPGVFVPPPAGLPTLTIGDGGVKTLEPTKVTKQPEKPTETSEPPETEPTVPCKAPRHKAADKAHAPIIAPAPSNNPTKPVPVSPPKPEDLPILPLLDVKNGAVGACGGGGSKGGYFNSGFYQFGDSFARTDGLKAVAQFCDQLAKNSSVLGPDGAKYISRPNPQKGAQHIYQGTFDFKNSGKITVRAIYDVDNRLASPMKEKDCNKNGDNGGPSLYNMDYNFCLTRGSQPVEYCDAMDKDTNDKSVKHGGTFYTKCTIWEVFKAPTGGDSGSPLPKPKSRRWAF